MDTTRSPQPTNAQINALALRYQAGDNAAFTELWDRWLQRYSQTCIRRAVIVQRVPEDQLIDLVTEVSLYALLNWKPKRATFKTYWSLVWRCRLKNAVKLYWHDRSKWERSMLELDRPLDDDKESTLADEVTAPVVDWERARAIVEERVARLNLAPFDRLVVAEHIRDPSADAGRIAKRLGVGRWRVWNANERIKRKGRGNAIDQQQHP